MDCNGSNVGRHWNIKQLKEHSSTLEVKVTSGTQEAQISVGLAKPPSPKPKQLCFAPVWLQE